METNKTYDCTIRRVELVGDQEEHGRGLKLTVMRRQIDAHRCDAAAWMAAERYLRTLYDHSERPVLESNQANITVEIKIGPTHHGQFVCSFVVGGLRREGRAQRVARSSG